MFNFLKADHSRCDELIEELRNQIYHLREENAKLKEHLFPSAPQPDVNMEDLEPIRSIVIPSRERARLHAESKRKLEVIQNG